MLALGKKSQLIRGDLPENLIPLQQVLHKPKLVYDYWIVAHPKGFATQCICNGAIAQAVLPPDGLGFGSTIRYYRDVAEQLQVKVPRARYLLQRKRYLQEPVFFHRSTKRKMKSATFRTHCINKNTVNAIIFRTLKLSLIKEKIMHVFF